MGRFILPDDEVCLATLYYRKNKAYRDEYYQKNKEIMRQKSRDRYNNDPEYREKQLIQKKKSYQQKKTDLKKNEDEQLNNN